MKHFKLISLLSIIFAFSTAQAETTVGGELWADFDVVIDNDSVAGGGDRPTPIGAEINRARINVSHSINENWSANLKYDAADSELARANIVAENWLGEGSTLRIGKQNNAYREAFDKHHNIWLHRNLSSEFSEILFDKYDATGDLANAGLTSYSNLENFTGLYYNFRFSDMWNAGITVNSGPTDGILNGGGNNGPSHDIIGYGIFVDGWFTPEFGILLGYDTFASGFLGNDDTNPDNVDGFTAANVSLIYKHDMFDVSLEYALWQHDAVGTDLEDASAFALSADYKVNDSDFVHIYYVFTTDFDEAGETIDGGLESYYRVGYNWGLDDGINTGVYYTAKTRDTDNLDESLVEWKWAANF